MKIVQVDNKYWHLVLETSQDVKFFIELDGKIKSHQSVNLWFGFHSQKGLKRDLPGFAAHELEGNNAPAAAMATYISLAQLAGESVNLAKYCVTADQMLNSFHNSIAQSVAKGFLFRINNKGCGCPIAKDLSDYTFVQDINEIEMYNFLVNGSFDMEFKLKNKTIVIENASYVPKKVIEKYCAISDTAPETIQIVNSFKQKCILFDDKDYIKLFIEGVENGLENIVFETSGQDEKNISNLIKIFGYIANKYPDKHFNIYVLTYNKELFTTELPNVTVVFL